MRFARPLRVSAFAIVLFFSHVPAFAQCKCSSDDGVTWHPCNCSGSDDVRPERPPRESSGSSQERPTPRRAREHHEPGTPSDEYPNVVYAPHGKLRAAPGYRWTSPDKAGDFSVERDPRFIFDEGDTMHPALGYKWVSRAANDFRIEVDPLYIRSDEDSLTPAVGYDWVSDVFGDLRVELSSVDTRVEDVTDIVAEYETRSGFESPLRDPAVARALVESSEENDVPLWLILAQARRETSFGHPKNGTTRDGVTFTDGTTGNAHNLFNVRPGGTWTGRVLDLKGHSGKFRVYDSYQEGIRDYTSIMGRYYRGLTLEQIAYKYFPPLDNGGTRAVEEYIRSVVGFAKKTMGATVKRETVPIPQK